MEEEIVHFRPAKRRKFLKRHTSLEGELAQTSHSKDSVRKQLQAGLDDESSADFSNILKLRKQPRSRSSGVIYSNAGSSTPNKEPEFQALSLAEPAPDRVKAISDRFIGHTGQTVDVDKHMMEYIDSEMAKRHTKIFKPASSPTKPLGTPSASESGEDLTDEDLPPTAEGFTNPSIRNPASLGQLQEIDLGPSARSSAAPLTTADLITQPLPRQRRRKPRLGRDGKPLKPRPQRRRPSADIARDALVEQILNENPGLDHYDTTKPPTAAAPGRDDDADERLALQFQQDFLDAVASRQQRKDKAAPGGESGQKGPKLGGSRSARAAMAAREREVALKQQQQGKK